MIQPSIRSCGKLRERRCAESAFKNSAHKEHLALMDFSLDLVLIISGLISTFYIIIMYVSIYKSFLYIFICT